MRRTAQLAAIIAATPLFIILASALGQAGRPAQPPQDEDRQVLRSLLDEVRQLRLALQRADVVSRRIHVTVERVRLRQARVDSIGRALEGARSRLADLRAARPQIEEQVKSAEESAENTADPARRAGLEQEVKWMKGRLAVWAREEEQLRAREAELMSELQVEQARLGELHDRLEDMARELEAP